MFSKTAFKGIVHPKMKILSSFTLHQVVANRLEFFFFLIKTKKDVFEEYQKPNS